MSKAGIQRRTKKREELILAAERLFLEKGIRQVSVEEIVRQAGVSKATFYKYFTDKKDILDKFLRKSASQVMDNLQELLNKGKQGRMTKEDFLRIFDLNEYDRMFKSNLLIELVQDYPDYLVEFKSWYMNSVMQMFYELVRIAKIDGIIRMDVDTDVLMIYVQTLRRMEIREDSPVLQRMSFKEFNKKYMDLFLYGVMGNESREPFQSGQA